MVLSGCLICTEKYPARSVDAWVDGFMHDFKRLHSVDRRASNGGGHTKEEIAKVTQDWERKADWIRHVERLRHAGVEHEFKTALQQRGIRSHRLVAGKRVTNQHYRKMLVRLVKWCKEPNRERIMRLTNHTLLLALLYNLRFQL